jgi:hypothetical protein
MAMTGAQRQARYIAKLKSQAAHADVLAVRNAELEAQMADARLRRFEAQHEAGKPARKQRGRTAAHAR